MYKHTHTHTDNPHGNTRVASFQPIVLMDPVNTLFWDLVSGWKHLKTLPLFSRVDVESAYFAYRWRHRPAPRPRAFHLWTPRCPITTTTAAVEDFVLVLVLQKISSLSELVDDAEQRRIMDDRLTKSSSCCVWFLLLLSVCLQRASIVGDFQAPPIGWNMNYSVLSRYSGSIWTQIFLKRWRRRRGTKRCVLRSF